MSRLKVPYGTTAELAANIVQEREVAYDTTLDRLVYGDGVDTSGIPLATGEADISAAMAAVVEAATVLGGARLLGEAETGYARTSWYGTDDAALTSAKTTAGTGGTVIIDSTITLSSTATLAGYITRFEGGTIAPPASSATLTIGKIEAPVAQVFTGANKDRVRVNGECDFVRPEWWGALGDGATDDYSAIMAAYAAIPSYGGEIRLRNDADYAVSQTIVLGDGTTTAISTKNAILFRGEHGHGVGAGEYGSGLITTIKWIGANSTSSTVFQMNGGIHSCVIENFLVNCNGTAGIGIVQNHLYRCAVRNVYVENWKAGSQFAWQMIARDNAAYASPYSAGTTQGFMENTFGDWGCRTPPSGVANCVIMEGGNSNNIGFSRNHFGKHQLARGDDSASISLAIDFIDNNAFYDGFLVSSNATPNTGTALQRRTQSGGAFPESNAFYGARMVGAITTVDHAALTTSTDGGRDCAYGYGAILDGAPRTFGYGFRAISAHGELLGDGWFIANSTATTAKDYLALKPTDYGTNKPGLFVSKSATQEQWNVALYDGTDNDGVLNISSFFQWALASATTAKDYIALKPTDYGSNKPGLFVSKSATQDRWDIGTYDGTDSDGTVGVTANTEIELNSALIDINGRADFSAPPVGVPFVLAQSAVAVVHTGTTAETVLATIPIAAGLLGANGQLLVTTLWSMTSSGNNKTQSVRLGGIGGTVFQAQVLTASASSQNFCRIANRNSESSQVSASATSFGFNGNNAVVTGTINTANAQDLVLTATLASSGETITLESYLVEVIYKA